MIIKYPTDNYESIARGKNDNKKELSITTEIKQAGNLDPDKMLITMMCRLAEQKSIQEVIEASERINQQEGVQLLIVGEPANHYIRNLIYRRINQNNVFVHSSFADPELQHKILAASDAILQPSKWEPCGYTQLEGMAYGAIPIVTAVGGHKDTVISIDEDNGYGIFIGEPTTDAIFKGIEDAVTLFKNEEGWKKAVMNAVRADFTWSGPRDSVGKYIRLYEEAAKLHKEEDTNTDKQTETTSSESS